MKTKAYVFIQLPIQVRNLDRMFLRLKFIHVLSGTSKAR